MDPADTGRGGPEGPAPQAEALGDQDGLPVPRRQGHDRIRSGGDEADRRTSPALESRRRTSGAGARRSRRNS
ncbi:hypothetical protein IscW_ISCW006527 [Ixodes scapularis]|uniref:Uncharacterized protein n=1 Tax=Ixodes scapularis TaxID=6945 RepID=B7PNT6_IXOSC|nr:hypothetical protein IscW_ISCW006527 [Ixodes scapularis]|eukprot:XP_002435428.1 hypothetical protein IscW_ISCW006527 [Ixodes scapularis]